MKKTLFFAASFVLLLTVSFLTGPGCANIVPPQGGPRDSLPPVLVSAAPADSTVNFRANRITLQFNEFVDLQDVQNNLLFTPLFENVPIVEARLRTITIRLRDSLEANTTYIFNFGNAVRDINENNVLRNFVYTFSTGPALDSLNLNGKVLLAETGGTDSTLIVVLHRSLDDSAVAKQRPRYVARVDREGNFSFRNLPRDTFAIYALGDAGIMRRYTTPSQTFAFADTPVVSGADSALTLYAYREVPKTQNSSTGTSSAPASGAANDRRLRLTTSAGTSPQDLLKPFVITFEQPLRSFDSAKVQVSTDTAFTPVGNYRFELDSTRRNLSLQTDWQPATQYNLIVQKDFAEDSTGRQLLKADTLSFTTRRTEDYGNLVLTIRNLDTSLNPVLQFVQNEKVVLSASIKSGVFRQALFLPGDYELRILYDRNNNGQWDPGKFFGEKRQPELVRPLNRRLAVRARVDNELDLEAPE